MARTQHGAEAPVAAEDDAGHPHTAATACDGMATGVPGAGGLAQERRVCLHHPSTLNAERLRTPTGVGWAGGQRRPRHRPPDPSVCRTAGPHPGHQALGSARRDGRPSAGLTVGEPSSGSVTDGLRAHLEHGDEKRPQESERATWDDCPNCRRPAAVETGDASMTER